MEKKKNKKDNKKKNNVIENSTIISFIKNHFLDIIIIILILVITYSSVIYIDNKTTEKNTIKEIESTNITENNSKSVSDEINELKDKFSNEDITAILKIDDILYTPIAQGSDNQYYLKHSLYKNKSVIGSTFMDYRVNRDSKQINIYGHNHSRLNPPFKILASYVNENFYKEHKFIKLKIDNETYVYQIFSVALLEKVSTSEHMNISYNTNEEWLSHFNRLKNSSIFDIDAKIDENSKILVLQTCMFGKYRKKLLVISAVQL